VEPLIFGGGQERSLRPGTEDVAGAVGLAEAIHLAVADLGVSSAWMTEMRDRLQARLVAQIPGLRVNCQDAQRAPHVLSLGIPKVMDGAAFLMALDLEGVAASGGSACHSGAMAGSHVIAALYGADDPLATVRLSVGRRTSEADVDRGADVVSAVWHRLQSDA
jgi:cysteine desulfurase